MKTITKALAGSVVAGAMALSAVSPAFASDSVGHGSGGASFQRADYDYGRAGYPDGNDWRTGGRNGRHGYDRGFNMNPRQAVALCTRAAENSASRQSYGRANVTDIRDVRDTRWGFEVRGRIAVNSMGRGWRHGDNRYGYGWNNDFRGWNDNLRGYDSGMFSCKVERGRVVDMDFNGLRGL